MREFFSGLADGFRGFGESISVLVNSILLSIVYLIGIGIPSIIAKITGKRFVETDQKKSYWIKIVSRKKEEYYKQF